uniref:G_PROTEIN_RECEP_F1_2 domain-containing protein n=1 Tax=Caenorhabditis japonica TaxID=281687 RepID=A0A8R1HL72_CAEJA
MNAADDENNALLFLLNSTSSSSSTSPTFTPSGSASTLSMSTNGTTMSSVIQQEEICRFRGTTENYTIAVTFFIIFLLSVIGNSLVLIVIIKQRAMRSITNIYLMNLAASDMMLSVVCMPPTLVSMVMNCWMFGNYMCKILAYLQPVVVTASAYTLAVIAFERYFAICKPLHSRIWQTRSHAYAMITLVWTIAILANFLMLFMYEQQTYSSNGYTCAPIHPPIYHFAYQVYMTVVLLVIPLVVMTGLYGNVIHSLKSGIKLEIASVEPAPTTGLKTSTSSSHFVNSVLVGSTSLARAASCIALNQLSSLTPPPPVPRNRPQLLELPNTLEDFRVQTLHSLRRRSSSVCLPPPAIVAAMTDEQKLTFWQKLSNKLTFKQQDKSYVTFLSVPPFTMNIFRKDPNMAHRRSEASICTDNPSLRSTHTQKSAMAKQRVIKWSLNLSVWNSDINTFITLLTYISSCTNPITYCFLNKKFRNAIYATFGRKKNMRSHFQKVYIPVNGGHQHFATKTGEQRPIINRSVSSTYIPQHQAVYAPTTSDRGGVNQGKKPTNTHLISRTVHASLIHHQKSRKEEADGIF